MSSRSGRIVTLAALGGVAVGFALGRISATPASASDVVLDSVPAETSSASVAPIPSADAAPANAPQATPTPAAMSAGERERLALRRDELLQKFDFAPDRVRGGGWYTHKGQRVRDRYVDTYLRVAFNASGTRYLNSEYYGRSWLFHSRIVARVGEQVIETATIPVANLDTEVGSEGVWESARFVGASDGGLLRALQRADPAATVVRLRLLGEASKEYVLRTEDHAAIRESLELAEILRRIGAPARPRDSRRFVGDRRFGIYYPETCLEASSVPEEQKRIFIGADEAEEAGFIRSEMACARDSTRAPMDAYGEE